MLGQTSTVYFMRTTQANPSEHQVTLDEVITEGALASFLKEHPDTVRYRRLSGTGPRYVRTGPRSIRYLRADVLAWLEANTVTGPEAG